MQQIQKNNTSIGLFSKTNLNRFVFVLVFFSISAILSFSVGLANTIAPASLVPVLGILGILILLKKPREYYLLLVILMPLSNKISFGEGISLWGIIFPLLTFFFILNEGYKYRLFQYIFIFFIIQIIITFFDIKLNSFYGIGAVDTGEILGSLLQIMNLLLMISLTASISAIDRRFWEIVLLVPLGFLPVVIFQTVLQPEWGGFFSSDGYRVFGVASQPNAFALFMVFFILVLVSFFLEYKKPKYLILSIIYFLMIIPTYSRSGILNTGVGIVIITFLINYKFKINLRLLLITVVFIILGYFLYDFVILGTRLERIGTTDLVSERELIWNSIFKQIEGREFLGLGLGGYDIIQSWVHMELASHSSYIFMIVNIGIIGLIVFFLIITHILIRLYKVVTDIKIDKYDRVLARGALAILIVAIFSSFATALAITPQVTLFLGIVVGRSYFAKKNN